MSQRVARSEAAQLIGTGIEANGHYSVRADDWFHAYNQQTRADAESGSERLRDACIKLFWKFELRHRLPNGYGQKFMLEGYRS